MQRKNDVSMNKQAGAVAGTEKLAGVLLDLMDSLTKVMEDEVACLSRQDFSVVETLRLKKDRLFREYQTNIGTLAQQPALLKETSSDMRDKLRSFGGRLDQASRRNALALKGAMDATQSLVRTVVDAARSDTRHTDCYGDPRKTPLMLGSYSPVCKPVAVNRSV